MSQSKIVKALNIETAEELSKLTLDTTRKMHAVLARVIFRNMSYTKAGELYGVSKQSIYHQLRKVYKIKFGVDYVINVKNNEVD